MKILWSDLVVIFICCLICIRASVLKKDSINDIFTIPTKTMDDSDLLEEYGRFMLANMNPTIDPCENFYEYACGNWHQNDNVIPLLRRNGTISDAIQIKINQIIVEFLKNTTVMDDKTGETKAKNFFSSCMSMGEGLSQGYRTLYNSLKEPILKGGEKLDWMVLNFYSEYGYTPLLPLSIQYNRSSFMFEIYLNNPNNLMTLRHFNFTRMTEDYTFEDKEVVEREWEEVKSFEKRLLASVKQTNVTKSESLGDFLESHNSSDDVDWKRFFDLAFNGTQKNFWIINDNVMNFKNINKFLGKSETGVMFNYVKWSHIVKFYKIWKLEENKNLESNCRDTTIEFFESALTPWFIEATFDEKRREDALLISKHLKKTFYSLINQTTWLDNETKSGAKSKLRAMDFTFGYTDDMRDRSEIDETFKDVNITKNFWVNVMNLSKNRAKDILTKIGKAAFLVNIGIFKVNAFYIPELNQVFMCTTTSQLPFYHIKLPSSMKFGGIGSVVGHEMAHGFDSGGYKYDYDGKKRNWWSPESLRNFKERYQCLESQYNKFIFEGVQTSGKKTSGDNIADNVGLKIAYKSYLRFLDENLESGKDKPLPGVDFTNKELFFLMFAQSWCDGRSPDKRMKQVQNSGHSINEFQVIGTLMNMPEFSEEFNCALGTNMNPLNKCIIYGDE